ncbi:hypothetical protein COV53_07190, partial [Candidatus Gottesmanbacteria bacterium CG11_big_fil_rev_8_21_14_0_20_37_11]
MFKNTPQRTKGILALIFLAVIYGFTGVLTRYLNIYFSLFQQIYIRIFLGFVLGILLFRNSLDLSKLKKISKEEWGLLILRSAASFLIGAVLWVKASTITKLANISFIDALPLTATLSFLVGWDKASVRKIMLLLLSYIGVVILSVKDFSNITSFGFGELLVLASGLFFAYRNISRMWHSKLLNDQEITILMFFLGFIMLFFLTIFLGESLNFPISDINMVAVVLLGGVLMVINIFLTNYGFANVSL